jgi:14-3-3 protein epsilon
VNGFLGDKLIKAIPERGAKLSELNAQLTTELGDCCTQLIQPTDSKLLPAAVDAMTKVFGEKLRADYYQYSVDLQADLACQTTTDKAKTSSESAFRIVNSNLTKASAACLSLALNHSVFFCEIIRQRQEAIDFVDKSFKEAVDWLDELTEGQNSEAVLIFHILKDKVALWNEEQTDGKGHESTLMSCLSALSSSITRSRCRSSITGNQHGPIVVCRTDRIPAAQLVRRTGGQVLTFRIPASRKSPAVQWGMDRQDSQQL